MKLNERLSNIIQSVIKLKDSALAQMRDILDASDVNQDDYHKIVTEAEITYTELDKLKDSPEDTYAYHVQHMLYRRWKEVKDHPPGYHSYPLSPPNEACIMLSQAIAEEDLEQRPFTYFLMPKDPPSKPNPGAVPRFFTAITTGATQDFIHIIEARGDIPCMPKDSEWYGASAIIIAAYFGRKKILDYLIMQKGLDYIFEEKDGIGWNVLHAAAANEQVGLLAWLLDQAPRDLIYKGANQAYTPLHVLVGGEIFVDPVPVAELLVEYGGLDLLTQETIHKQTAYDIALSVNNTSLASALEAMTNDRRVSKMRVL